MTATVKRLAGVKVPYAKGAELRVRERDIWLAICALSTEMDRHPRSLEIRSRSCLRRNSDLRPHLDSLISRGYIEQQPRRRDRLVLFKPLIWPAPGVQERPLDLRLDDARGKRKASDKLSTEAKTRKCLTCLAIFLSAWAGERRCNPCKHRLRNLTGSMDDLSVA